MYTSRKFLLEEESLKRVSAKLIIVKWKGHMLQTIGTDLILKQLIF
jgi:hypothetical protein